MNFKGHEEQESTARNKMKRRITQFEVFVVHCGEHIQRRERDLYSTHVV